MISRGDSGRVARADAALMRASWLCSELVVLLDSYDELRERVGWEVGGYVAE